MRRCLLLFACTFAALAFFGPPAARVAAADPAPVYVVLFTHVEDMTPGGTLGSPQSRQNYLLYRSRLIDMATLARDSNVPWSLQPDWKILEAALIYETDSLRATTNGKNFLRYIKEDLGARIDPHSHENGYNYTDVAHLLDSLGVGGSTVIGGHVWDPDRIEFQEWDRFRVPVQGEHYPNAWWRGDILMGSGTPNHVDDPIVSGVWLPRDRDHYFDHDPEGNIAAIGQYRGTVDGVEELHELYASGIVSPEVMLTSSYGIRPAALIAPNGIAGIADTVIAPFVAMRSQGWVVLTDFTALIATWQSAFESRSYLYDAQGIVGVPPAERTEASAPIAVFESALPNPARAGIGATLRFSLAHETDARLVVYDVRGREVAVVAQGRMAAGSHRAAWPARGVASGPYFCVLEIGDDEGGRTTAPASKTLVVVR